MSKLYYSSSEVSTMLELEPSVLRFWEDQFGQLRIKRNRAGKRMYREKDIELIRTIKQLTRDEGYTIAGAKKKLQESAANRGAQKAVRTAERADRGAEQAASGPEKADPGTVHRRILARCKWTLASRWPLASRQPLTRSRRLTANRRPLRPILPPKPNSSSGCVPT